jgi:RNA polymerase sigma factor (TIGR02999 family)
MSRDEVSRSPEEITGLLQAWSEGDRTAFDQLAPVVYQELRRLARHYMAGERQDHTLQPTALVHEAYVRLADFRHLHWKNRIHFFAISAQVMRRVLVDFARSRKRGKREEILSVYHSMSVSILGRIMMRHSSLSTMRLRRWPSRISANARWWK